MSKYSTYIRVVNDDMQSMAKNSEKPRTRDSEVAGIVKKTARICGVSIRTVQRVIIGQQKNDEVLAVFMDLQQGFEEVVISAENNRLLAAVKDLVPFDNN
jgi:hypothetical protein